ncbi:MAG: SPOR domain-containing protein [Bacteroidales bacterium]
MKRIIGLLSFLLVLGSAFGQNSRNEISQLGIFSSEDNSQAKIFINQPTELNDIIIAKTQVPKEIETWAIQIYMGSGKNSRAVAQSTLSSFKAKYPEVEARLLYPSPYFKVQVGNFRTRIEAESFRQKIIGEYTNARIELVSRNKEN